MSHRSVFGELIRSERVGRHVGVVIESLCGRREQAVFTGPLSGVAAAIVPGSMVYVSGPRDEAGTIDVDTVHIPSR